MVTRSSPQLKLFEPQQPDHFWMVAMAMDGRELIQFQTPHGEWNVASKMCLLAIGGYERGEWTPGQPFFIADLFKIPYQMLERDVQAWQRRPFEDDDDDA